MKRVVLALAVLLSISRPSYAQQWDQVNGSMQVKSGPTAPLVIIDQTASGQKIISLRANGTEVCYATSSAFTCTGGFTFPTSCTGTYTGPFTNGVTSTGQCVNGTSVTTTTATAVTVATGVSLNLSESSSGGSDTLRLTGTQAGNGILVGADTNLYRLSANQWVTDDSFRVTGTLDVVANGIIALAAPAWVRTAPTVTSAGTSPSVTASNGTAAFRVNVGTGGTATTIVMAMPAATTGWNCSVENITATAANRAAVRTVLQSSTTTSVTVQSQTVTTGTAAAFTASDIVAFMCVAF